MAFPRHRNGRKRKRHVPAHVVRALARAWGNKKTYLAAGGAGAGLGGACRTATGAQWARNMILMMAMQGWGKPGVNFGNLQGSTPLDFTFYFPGYAEGGISGDLAWTASAISNYERMPHVLTMNPVKQMIPRQRFPDAIIEGKCKGYVWDGSSLEAQFAPFEYPMPGYSRVHMLYRYGGSSFGTIANSRRFIEAYRHPSLEFVVNQSIWFEGEAKFADVILPACTSFERWSTSASGRGRAATGITPRASSTIAWSCSSTSASNRSASRSPTTRSSSRSCTAWGWGRCIPEGCSEIDWVKRVFDSSDLPKHMSWREFVKKGYFVVPAEPEATRDPVYFRWYAEDRAKDVPEPHPLPSQYTDDFGMGLQTPSGKIEFVATTIERGDPGNPERPALNRYIPAWEGPRQRRADGAFPAAAHARSHSRYSFHTYCDGKDSAINDIEDHRVRIDGYDYWVLRVSAGRRQGTRHRASRSRPGAQPSRRGDLRRRCLAADRARRGEVLPGFREFRSDRGRRPRSPIVPDA